LLLLLSSSSSIGFVLCGSVDESVMSLLSSRCLQFLFVQISSPSSWCVLVSEWTFLFFLIPWVSFLSILILMPICILALPVLFTWPDHSGCFCSNCYYSSHQGFGQWLEAKLFGPPFLWETKVLFSIKLIKLDVDINSFKNCGFQFIVRDLISVSYFIPFCFFSSSLLKKFHIRAWICFFFLCVRTHVSLLNIRNYSESSV
jgi:hypothetical protein